MQCKQGVKKECFFQAKCLKIEPLQTTVIQNSKTAEKLVQFIYSYPESNVFFNSLWQVF